MSVLAKLTIKLVSYSMRFLIHLFSFTVFFFSFVSVVIQPFGRVPSEVQVFS